MKLLAILSGLRASAFTALRSLLLNLPIAAVALVLALVLWVAVTNEENPTLRREVPFQAGVEEVNIPRSFVVSSINPDKVSVTVIGPRDRVTRVRPEDLTVRVNLSGALTAGAGPAQPLRFSAPTEVTVRQRGVQAEVSPQTVEVTLESEVRRTVPIRVNAMDALPLGFEMAEAPSAQPAQATVIGAKQNVDLVDAAVADVKLDGLTVNIDKSLPLDPRDSEGHSIGHVTVEPIGATVSLKVRQVLFSRQLLVDPHIHGRPAPGYAIGDPQAQPSALAVIGSLDALNQASTLPTQDVDVEGAASDVVRTVTIQVPPGLSLADPRASAVVKVPIQPQVGPGSLGIAPRVVGVSTGLTASLQTPTVVVNLTGPLPTLLRLVPADVVVTVDTSGLGPGTYRLEPKVGLPPGIQLDGVVPDRVTVLISSGGISR